MFLNALVFMFIAWILSFFGYDTMVINGMNELFGINMTHTGYYFGHALLGMVAGLFSLLSRRGNQ